jgi:hypothetical protein
MILQIIRIPDYGSPHDLLFEVFGDEKLQKFNIRMDDKVIIQFEPNARESKVCMVCQQPRL